LFCSKVSGWDSTAIRDEMMPFTSSPLPMPAELMEPVVVLVVVLMDFLAVLERTIGAFGGFLRRPARAEAVSSHRNTPLFVRSDPAGQ
jgi:hypothetical protein